MGDYVARFRTRIDAEGFFEVAALLSSASKRVALRAKICLEFDNCGSVSRVAAESKTTIKTVQRNLDRFLRYGLAGLTTLSLPHGRSTRREPAEVRRKLLT